VLYVFHDLSLMITLLLSVNILLRKLKVFLSFERTLHLTADIFPFPTVPHGLELGPKEAEEKALLRSFYPNHLSFPSFRDSGAVFLKFQIHMFFKHH